MKFRVITADPAWTFGDKLTMSEVARGAASNYPCLDLTAMLGVSWHLHEADHTCPIGIVWLIGLTAAFTITIAEYANRR